MTRRDEGMTAEVAIEVHQTIVGTPHGVVVIPNEGMQVWGDFLAPLPTPIDLSREWALTFDRWMEDSAGSDKTRRAYRRVWDDFLTFCATLPATND